MALHFLTLAQPLTLLRGKYAACASAALCFLTLPTLAQAEPTIRWNNTIHYSSAVRLETPAAIFLADSNADDGDRNFRSGVVSNRLDLLSELNITTDDFGIEASATAWYDTLYHRRTGNDSRTSLNTVSNGPDKFAKPVRQLQGRDAELLTAFVFSTFYAGEMPVSVRAGRSHLQWGESLFFADNGIASGQTPVDGIKGLSVPNSKAKEIYLPVAQIWASVQPSTAFSIEAYYQLEWRKSRLPGSGSYFSVADFLDAGGERLIVGPGQFFQRAKDQPASDSGQYGVALRLSRGEGDYGLYALRYNAKDPQLYLRLGPFIGVRTSSTPAEHPTRERVELYGLSPTVTVTGGNNQFRLNYGLYGDPRTGEVGSYQLSYPEGIQAYGASYSSYIGNTTVGAEISTRRHMPLASKTLVLFESVTANNNSKPLYAIGDTVNGQISAISVLPPSRLWQGATLAAEVALNHRLRVTSNPTALDTDRDHTAASLRVVFEPQYFAVVPGLDVTMPVGIGMGLTGNSSITPSQNAGAGDVEIGVRTTYRAVWEVGFQFTHFIGAPKRQPFADRDFVSFSIKRAF